MKSKKIFNKFTIFIFIFLVIISLGFSIINLLLNDNGLIQKNVEVKIDINNIINICKTQEDDDLIINF